MQCLTHLIPATAVTHCVSLPFLSSSANNLVVAKTSLLQIFSFKSVAEDASEVTSHSPIDQDDPQNKGPPRTSKRERVQTTKLVLIAQHELAGTVTALARVKLLRSRSGGEALLVGVKDAKLSLVEWDPERYGVLTISIHYYERDDLQEVPWNPPLSQCVNYLTVDPGSRCAALKFGARHLAILPFHQAGDDLVMEDYDPDVGISPPKSGDLTHKIPNGDLHLPTPYAASFVLSLLALDPILMHPIHMAFLFGYREPTFGILSSQIAPSSALLSERKDPISYTVYTLDLDQRASTTLLSIPNLPYDLHTVLPVPLPIGGALLIGQNELIHVDQSGKTTGIAVNEFTSKSTNFAIRSEVHLGLRLEGCVIEQLGAPNGDMLIILKNGELAILRFKIDGRSVSGLSVKPVHQPRQARVYSSLASCTAGIGRGRIFVGCEDNDSIILGWSSRSTKIKRQRSIANIETEDGLDASDIDEVDIEDEDDLYSNEKPSGQTITQLISPAEDEGEEYVFRIHDCLQNIAPLGNVTFLEPDSTMDGQNGSSSQIKLNPQLVITSGRSKACMLGKMSPTTNPHVHKRHVLGNIQGVWSVVTKISPKDGHQECVNGNGLAETRNIIITSMVDDFGEEQSHTYSVDEDEIEEVAVGDFDTDAGATIAVGTLNGGTQILQVLKAEIRSYEDGEFRRTFLTRVFIYIIERFTQTAGSVFYVVLPKELHVSDWYCGMATRRKKQHLMRLSRQLLLGDILLLIDPNLCYIVSIKDQFIFHI